MKKWSGILFVVLSAILFGSLPLISKIINTNGGNAVATAFYRVFLALPVVYIMMRIQVGRKWRLPPAQFRKIFILSIAFSVTPLMMLISYNYINSGMATSFLFVYPVFVLLGGILFYKDPIRADQILCAILCMAGVYLCYSPDYQGNITGILLPLLAGLTYSFYILYLGKSGLSSLPSFQLGFHILAFASAELLLFAALSGNLTVHMTATGWLATVCFALIASACAGLLFQVSVKRIGPQNAAILSALEPLTSIIISAIILNEPFSEFANWGIFLILSSTTVMALIDKNHNETEQNTQLHT